MRGAAAAVVVVAAGRELAFGVAAAPAVVMAVFANHVTKGIAQHCESVVSGIVVAVAAAAVAIMVEVGLASVAAVWMSVVMMAAAVAVAVMVEVDVAAVAAVAAAWLAAAVVAVMQSAALIVLYVGN